VLAEPYRFHHNLHMDSSPPPWPFAERLYGIVHCLIDRDGRLIGCNLPIGSGLLLEQAPAMAALLRGLVDGCSPEELRRRAAEILERVDKHHTRERARMTTSPQRSL
jgi:hypothetical protein